MRQIFIIVIILLSIVDSAGQNVHRLRLVSIKKTMLEQGVTKRAFEISDYRKGYKHSRFLLDPSKNILSIINKKNSDTIFLTEKYKISGVEDSDELRRYPTDNIYKCFESKGKDCKISKTLRLMLNSKTDNIYLAVGKTIFFEESNNQFIFFYLENKRYALLSNNEFILLVFKAE